MNKQQYKDELNSLAKQQRAAQSLETESRNALVKEIGERRAQIQRAIGGRGPVTRAFERIAQRAAEELARLSPEERVAVIDATIEHLVTSSANLYQHLKEKREAELRAAAEAPAEQAAA